MNDLHLYCYACMSRLPEADCVCPHCGHDNHVRSAGPDCLPATVLAGQYYIGKPLGRGGFGVTYIGLDKGLNRLVAVKEYYPVSTAVRDQFSQTLQFRTGSVEDFRRGCERALEEGRLAAQMGHVPGVVQLYNAFEANGTVYIVMEYIKGRTLADVIRRDGKVGWQQLYKLMEPLMHTLSTIHGKKVVHRDVSPDNIMIRDEDGSAVLLDFGAAHTISDRTMGEHSVSLRMGYAPIEQYSAMGKQDGRIDEYALCATMYHALTGQRPPDATERAFGGTELARPRALGSDIPANAENALMKGLALKAKDRFPDVETLRAAIKGEKAIPGKNGKAPAIAVVAAALVLAVGALFLLPANEAPKDPPAEPAGQTAVVTAEPEREYAAPDGLRYLLKGGEATVTGYTGTAAEVTIPETVEGLPVTGLTTEVFDQNSFVRIVSLPDSIHELPGDAFRLCAQLEEVRLPAGLAEIPPGLFYGSDLLHTVTIPESVASIGEDAFRLCDGLTSLRIPESVAFIGNKAFTGCRRLTLQAAKDSYAWKWAEENGVPVQPDEKEAAADAQALYETGLRYYNEKDYEQAVYWYRKAAEAGDADAMNYLGICCYLGRGTAQDYEQAVQWYLQAVEAGNVKAMNNLAVCYEAGKGVEQDLEQANYWFDRYNSAVGQGN